MLYCIHICLYASWLAYRNLCNSFLNCVVRTRIYSIPISYLYHSISTYSKVFIKIGYRHCILTGNKVIVLVLFVLRTFNNLPRESTIVYPLSQCSSYIDQLYNKYQFRKSLDSILQNKVSARWSGKEFIKIFENMRRALYEDSPVMQTSGEARCLACLAEHDIQNFK